jgi:hypothetical protein
LTFSALAIFTSQFSLEILYFSWQFRTFSNLHCQW